MRYRLSEIAKEAKVSYDGEEIWIDGIHTLSDAGASALSFIDSARYLPTLKTTKAAAVLLPQKYLSSLPGHVKPLISEHPHLAVARVSKLFATEVSGVQALPSCGEGCHIDSSAVCAEDVVLGDRVRIMAGCVLGEGVHVGSDTILYPNVTLYRHTRVGRSCILHAGVVIGADGYGFVKDADGSHVKFYQNGHVEIADHVEIGANSTVDRATFGATTIGEGTKIDNLVQVAHNCQIGKHCLLVCQTALAGSTVLEDHVTMGGQSGATGHLRIGAGAVIASRSGVTKSLAGSKVYGGFPAVEQKLWLKMQARLLQLVKRK